MGVLFRLSVVLGAAAMVFWRRQQLRDAATRLFGSSSQSQHTSGSQQPFQPRSQGGPAQSEPAATFGQETTVNSDNVLDADASAPTTNTLSASTGEGTSSFNTARAADVGLNTRLAQGFGGNGDAAAPNNGEGSTTNTQNTAIKDDPDAGQLEAFGDDAITTDRVRSNLGHELHGAHMPRLNINTQAGGVVYLRGMVQSEEQRTRILRIVEATEGVGDIVDEMQIEQEMQ